MQSSLLPSATLFKHFGGEQSGWRLVSRRRTQRIGLLRMATRLKLLALSFEYEYLIKNSIITAVRPSLWIGGSA